MSRFETSHGMEMRTEVNAGPILLGSVTSDYPSVSGRSYDYGPGALALLSASFGRDGWDYLHASHQSAGVIDRCGDPAPFPGCVTLWKSHDGGLTFGLESPRCLFPCTSCPCDADHPHQQPYPRVFFDADRAYIAYEWGAGTYMRTSADGVNWSGEAHVPGTGQWHADPGTCAQAESVGEHPNIYAETE